VKKLEHPFSCFEIVAIDSDTLTAWVEIDRETRHKWRIRLKGIEGGEKGTTVGERGHGMIQKVLWDKAGQHSNFFGNPNCKDKYGRRVGDILFEDGTHLTRALMATGYFWRRDRSGKEYRNQTTSKE
jgi:endonuclease YncB( thermonuclease family)